MGIADAKKKMEALEAAVHHLDAVKRHLNLNATEVKSKIHAAISRNLEALRNREVWLLGQVDVVTGVKEATLQQQQARLNQSLGVLSSALAMARTDPNSCQDQLSEAINSLELDDLKPEETPYISFRADQATMREAIMSYGRVDANGMPLQSAFVEHGHPSASLPRHFEEYEDADSHVFYKTVEEIRRSRSDSGSIYVNIPKLSTRAEDWLFRPTTTVTTSSDLSPRCALPTLGKGDNWAPPSSKEESSPLPRLASNASIRSWLSQIQRNPDLEDEDDFEIVDHSATSISDAGESTQSSAISPAMEVELTLGEGSSGGLELEKWLRRPGPTPVPQGAALENPFRHIPRSPETWLARRAAAAAAKSEACEGSGCCKRGAATDLEELGNSPCLPSGTSVMGHYLAQRPKDLKAWLSASSRSDPKPAFTPSPHRRTSPITEVCKANELCSSFSDCVCSPHCGTESLDKWLLSRSAANQDPSRPICLDQFLPPVGSEASSETSSWLQVEVSEAGSSKADAASPAACLPALPWDSVQWLRKHQPAADNKSSEEGSSGAIRFPQLEGELRSWLSSESPSSTSSTLPSCPTLEVLRKSHAQLKGSDWLHRPMEVEEEKEKECMEEKDSDKGWVAFKLNASTEGKCKEVSPGLGEWLYSKRM